MLSILVLVMLVYCAARKNNIAAMVLSIPRQISNEGLLGIIDTSFLYIIDEIRIKPKKNLKKITSIAEIEDVFVNNLEKTVEPVKHNSAINIKMIPLYMINQIPFTDFFI